MLQKLMGEQLKQKMSLDPYMKGASSALKKLGEKQATEAAMQVGADQVSSQLNQMASGNQTTSGMPTQPGQAQAGQPAGADLLQQLLQAQQSGGGGLGFDVKSAKGPFSQSGLTVGPEGNITLQQGGFFDLNQEAVTNLIKQIAGLQTVTGKEPIQPKDVVTLQQQALIETVKLAQKGQLQPNNILTNFEQASKAFITVRDAQAKIENIQSGTGFDDLGLIFSFMKVLDPNSVVRESEFANAAEAASYLNRTYGKVVRFTKGGRLAPESREELVDTSRRIFQAAQKQQQQTTEGFRQLAVQNNIDPRNVIRDVGLALPKEQKKIEGKAQTQPGTKAVTSKGTPYEITGD